MTTRQAILPLGNSSPQPWLGPALLPGRCRIRQVRKALEPVRLGSRLGWSLDPYRGNEVELFPTSSRPRPRVSVKRGLSAALESELGQTDMTGARIFLGRKTDPYQPIERSTQTTRRVLEVLAATRGLDLVVTTSSPLVLRDLELWRQLDFRHVVTVRVVLPTLDVRLARLLEKPATNPRDRLETARRLARDGIAVQIVCSPILPGINNGADELDPVFVAARAAGAIDVVTDTLHLDSRTRRRFFAWLKQEFPDLAPLYRHAPSRGAGLSRQNSRHLLGTFERLRLAYGFPSTSSPSRG